MLQLSTPAGKLKCPSKQYSAICYSCTKGQSGPTNDMAVLLETSVGDIEIDLYVDEAPKECLNFLKLCKTKYYNFSLFHRVLKNFIAQTGDPTSIGRGGECIWGIVKYVRIIDLEASIHLTFMHCHRRSSRRTGTTILPTTGDKSNQTPKVWHVVNDQQRK